MDRAGVPSVAVLVGLAVWVASLGLYISTLAPTLSWGYDNRGLDGGELLAAASTLGIPHPPGYPTYTLLLKAFATLVPIGDFAYRGNLMSAVLASVAVALLYMTALRFCRFLRPQGPSYLWIVSAALAATVFAASPLFWSQATITEVYSLNAVFVGLLLLIATRLALRVPSDETLGSASSSRWMAVFAFIAGVGLGNHLTLLAIIVPLVAWMWAALGWRRVFNPWAVGALVLGLGIYAYMPIRAGQSPPVNWGDAGTLSGMGWMLSGRIYQDYVFGIPVESVPDRLIFWLKLVFEQFNPLGIFLGLVGAAALFRQARTVLGASLVSILALSAYSISYRTVDWEVLIIPSSLLFSLWIGVGALWVFSDLAATVRELLVDVLNMLMRGVRITTAHSLVLLVVVAFGALPVTSLVLNYGAQNLRNDRIAFNHARDIMDSVSDGSLVLSTAEDTVFSLWYMRYVEDRDRDVAPIAVPLLGFDWYWRDIRARYPNRFPVQQAGSINQTLRDIVEHNEGASDVYFTYQNAFLLNSFDLEPLGPVNKARVRQTE